MNGLIQPILIINGETGRIGGNARKIGVIVHASHESSIKYLFGLFRPPGRKAKGSTSGFDSGRSEYEPRVISQQTRFGMTFQAGRGLDATAPYEPLLCFLFVFSLSPPLP